MSPKSPETLALTGQKRKVSLLDLSIEFTGRTTLSDTSTSNASPGTASTSKPSTRTSSSDTTGTYSTDNPHASSSASTRHSSTDDTSAKMTSGPAEEPEQPEQPSQPSPRLTDVAKVQPWQVGLREGSIFATPPSRATGGSRVNNASKDQAYWNKMVEKGWYKQDGRKR